MKSKIIDLARYKKRRQQYALDASTPEASDDSSISIQLSQDGTHAVRIAGAYARSHPLAIEALAELIAILSKTVRHHLGRPNN